MREGSRQRPSRQQPPQPANGPKAIRGNYEDSEMPPPKFAAVGVVVVGQTLRSIHDVVLMPINSTIWQLAVERAAAQVMMV